MVWFTNQSLPLIALSFLLGLLVGYLWWGLRLRRVRTSDSTAAVATPAAFAAAPAPVTVTEPQPEPEPDPKPELTMAPPTVEPPTVEPATPEPAAVEPATMESAAVEPAAAEPSTADVAVDDALVADVESAFAESPIPDLPSTREPASTPDLPSTPEPASTPELTPEPASADDLARIEGIGPKIAAALGAAGITTYAALADAGRSTVEDALADASLRFAPSLATWSQQARLLADGDEEGFKVFTDRLIAGREVSTKTTADGPEPATEPTPEPAAEAEPLVAEPPAEPPAEPLVAEPPAEPLVAEVSDELLAAEPEPDALAELAEAEAEPIAPAVPAQVVAVEDGPVDDLKRIEGIGPKMSAALIASGIRTFAQLASADVNVLRAALEAAGLRFAPSIVTWSRQAQLLADGDEAGFADLTRRLVAGRDTGRA